MAVLIILLLVYYFVLQNQKNHETASEQPSVTTNTLLAATSDNKSLNDTSIEKKYLIGKFDPSRDKSFTECDPEYASRTGIYVQVETYKAFIKMFYAAKNAGVNLKIISGTRNFSYQKSIWEAKWNGSRLVEGKNLAATVKDPAARAAIILKYSSMPGTSRHHWGTDVDLNSLDPKYFETGVGKKVYDWLCSNASKYGFCQPYTAFSEDRMTGYQEEKWHWSYIPTAKLFLLQYKSDVTYDDISGFSGSQTARDLKVIDDFVISVNKVCN